MPLFLKILLFIIFIINSENDPGMQASISVASGKLPCPAEEHSRVYILDKTAMKSLGDAESWYIHLYKE